MKRFQCHFWRTDRLNSQSIPQSDLRAQLSTILGNLKLSHKSLGNEMEELASEGRLVKQKAKNLFKKKVEISLLAFGASH